MSVVELTKHNFDETIANNDIVVIDFWAPWCQPCLSFAPTFEAVASANPGVVFAKINVEQEQELAADFQVRSIPQLMIIRQSVALFSESGTMPESALQDLVEQAKALDMSDIKRTIKDQADGE